MTSKILETGIYCKVIGVGTLLSEHRGGQQVVPGGVVARDARLHVDARQLLGHVASQGTTLVEIDAIARHPGIEI